MMLLVATVAVVTWMSITALAVAHDSKAKFIYHLRQNRDTGEVFVDGHLTTDTFWPRYWRRLLGRPWPGSYVCPSCRERQERLEKHPLIDLDSSDDEAKVFAEWGRIEQERRAARLKATREVRLKAQSAASHR
jgi:hypothetical protein